MLRLTSSGLLLSNDGGNNWIAGLTTDGISANLIVRGRINTNEIQIYNDNLPTFKWDGLGLTAYSFIENNGRTVLNPGRGVRFDRFGIYGYNAGTNAFEPSSIDDINDKSTFSLTWEGLYIKSKTNNGFVKIGRQSEALIQVNNGTKDTFIVDQNGNVTLAGTLSAATGTFAGELSAATGTFAGRIMAGAIIISDGDSSNPKLLFGANGTDNNYDINGNITSTAGTTVIGAHRVKIAGWNVTETELKNIDVTGSGTSSNPYIINSGMLIANGATQGYYKFTPRSATTGYRDWILLAGNNFGVTSDGKLYSTAGKIAGWNVDSNSLYSTASIGNVPNTWLSTGRSFTGTIAGHQFSNEPLMLKGGDKFCVTSDGVLYASGGNFSGTISASSGEISGDLDLSGYLTNTTSANNMNIKFALGTFTNDWETGLQLIQGTTQKIRGIKSTFEYVSGSGWSWKDWIGITDLGHFTISELVGYGGNTANEFTISTGGIFANNKQWMTIGARRYYNNTVQDRATLTFDIDTNNPNNVTSATASGKWNFEDWAYFYTGITSSTDPIPINGKWLRTNLPKWTGQITPWNKIPSSAGLDTYNYFIITLRHKNDIQRGIETAERPEVFCIKQENFIRGVTSFDDSGGYGCELGCISLEKKSGDSEYTYRSFYYLRSGNTANPLIRTENYYITSIQGVF